ncbi:MAG: amino acid adenylation domain-containing protein, partial [Deltaproteobacteria bacterium]|nr:amino acid adenylation domain-containing protein [Deltaproteobacteria bacterium]
MKKASKKIEDIYPLSPMQQGMLFHSLYDPDSPIYSERYTYTIEGSLDIECFTKAWEHLGKSHPIFRTIFRWEGLNHPVQVVLKDRLPEFHIHDLKALDEKSCKTKIAKFLDEDSKRTFNLSKGPLMRLDLFILEEERFYFAWRYHHILMDGWCLPLIMNDLFTAYLAVYEGKPLPDIKRPLFKNYISWLNKQDNKDALKYWKKLLNDFSTPTPLPLDYKPLRRDIYNVGKQTLVFSKEQTSLLESTARRMRLTLSTLVQGAWAILLGRYSNQDDVVFGATISGRPASLPSSDEMIGLFINTLPVRAKWNNSVTILNLLKEIQTQSLKIQEYEYSFLPDVRACSGVSGSKGLFDSIVIFENYPTNFEGTDIDSQIRISDFDAQEMTHYDLTLVIRPGSKMELCLEYANDLFKDATIEHMIGHLKNLLLDMAQDANAPISHLEFLGPDEKELLLRDFNDTEEPYPKDMTLVDLFESKVEDVPDRIAVAFDGNSLTYRELNINTNHLAHYLRDKGISPNDLVGIMIESPIETIMAIMGILKAGGVYLPIDPEFPKGRIEYILKDSNAPVIITTEKLSDRLPDYKIDTLFLDRDWGAISSCDRTNPDHVNTPEDIAYAIYTSGSTGRPKGTLVPHKGVVNLVYALQKEVYSNYSAPLNVAQVASFTFDASVQQIFASLLLGHRLYPIPGYIKRDMGLLIPYILEHNIEIIDGTPSLWELMVNSGIANKQGLNLKHVIIGGEPLATNLVERFYKGSSGREMKWTNVYGVTESSVDSTYFHVDLRSLGSTAYVPIGKPIANTRIYILDDNLNLMPVGIPGEMYIGGDGLAKGYLNNPEKTKQNFIQDPFSNNGILYKTGDLGKWLPDGNIEFLGRMDYQVKIRGFRIELGEVETVLSGYPDISDCVVIDKEDSSGTKYLIAYYVSDKEIPVPDLRGFLGKTLPDYMIPLRFVRLDALPLNPSGKVDRPALPDPEDLRPDTGIEYVAPRDDTEQIIADIWKEVLGLDRVGIYDNFFDLGGHSLKVTQVVSRIKKKIGIDLPVRSVFEEPTIEGLCRVIASLDSSEYKYRQIEVLPKQDHYELSHAQKRLWFLDQMAPDTATYNIPMAVVLEGDLDVGAMRDALQAVVDRHESLRTIFKDIEGNPVQVISDDFEVDLGVVDLVDRDASEDVLREVALEEVMRPFDLSKGPLFRTKLFKISDTSYLFVFTMHHIISDGWSMEILIKEVVSSYIALSKGEKPDFPELRIQYKDFAYWQNKLLEDGSLKDQEKYWLKKLGGSLPVLDLPTDRPRPPVQTQNGSVHRFSIDGALTSRLKELSKGHDVTLFMILLGAFGVLLNRLTHQEDIIIGSPIAGRNHPDLESLIGFFVNTLALRT